MTSLYTFSKYVSRFYNTWTSVICGIINDLPKVSRYPLNYLKHQPTTIEHIIKC